MIVDVSGEDAARHADDGPRLVVDGPLQDPVDAVVQRSAVDRVAGVDVTVLQIAQAGDVVETALNQVGDLIAE